MYSCPTIFVPAETWVTFTMAYSADLAVEHKGHNPLSVRTFRHGGSLYTVFACCYGRYSQIINSYYVEAWRLVLEAAFKGETTDVYHDEKAIASGRRRRGDMAGLVVSVGGKRMVCAEEIHFHQDLPGVAPMTITEAKAYDGKARGSGWRALFYKSRKPKWHSLKGHPVARYAIGDDPEKVHTVLFWRDGKTVSEMTLCNDVPLNAPPKPQTDSTAPLGSPQLSLF